MLQKLLEYFISWNKEAKRMVLALLLLVAGDVCLLIIRAYESFAVLTFCVIVCFLILVVFFKRRYHLRR